MLGCLKMDVKHCIDVYIGMMDSIFRRERLGFGITGGFRGRFSTEELERSIKRVIVDCGLPVDTTMRHQGLDENECKV
jgi:hypothetical protein